ncbi:hypothetical protein FA15DRAFT_596194 [Coprinopsis marcescibilis]|uniref:N-acetyltransferase domain-containing protein n=1 Tax=Coprinopsis marcescibilis TaxID=230819 RepID=A0A5C3KPX6_COPMA|nr:hypothetical protein FA15DRAFT_596194 [Coprinopsis marcescibilis]
MSSLTVTPKYIPHPTEPEIVQATKVLQAAFEGDPFNMLLTDGDPSLIYDQLYASVASTAVGGQLHVISVGPEASDIVGVACWFPPGTSLNSTPEQRAAGWDKFIAASPESLQKWWISYFVPTMTKLSNDTLGEGFALNAWQLHLFGVLPAYQGKGNGKALFKFAEKEAFKTNSTIIVETTTDVDVIIYTKLGLKIRDEITILNQDRKSRMVLMTKTPEGSRA